MMTQRCLACALALVRRINGDVDAVRVTIESEQHQLCLRFAGRAPPEEAAAVPQPTDRPEQAPASWKWFSPAEEAAVRACADGAWHTAEALAQATGEGLTTEFRALLRNLVGRNVLQSATSRGYRINREEPPVPAK